jgi:hypothetical protein
MIFLTLIAQYSEGTIPENVVLVAAPQISLAPSHVPTTFVEELAGRDCNNASRS